jgi:hypothetical protein
MQFRFVPLPQVRSRYSAQPSCGSDRGCPLNTARNRCLWHAGGTPTRTTMLVLAATAPSSPRSVRPIPGDHCMLARARRARGTKGGRLLAYLPKGALVGLSQRLGSGSSLLAVTGGFPLRSPACRYRVHPACVPVAPFRPVMDASEVQVLSNPGPIGRHGTANTWP